MRTDISVERFVLDSSRTYGKYVIYSRAMARLEDGLKPVQRRILHTMHQLKVFPGGNCTKSANITGTTMAWFHPHGDAAIYGALVSMTKQRYSLIHPQGNFGSATDPPAAPRYTEAKLSPLGKALFDCIDVAPKTQNYDNSKSEPVILDSRVPLLLMNGTEGIGYGIACNIPPHNLVELIGALKVLLTDKNATLVDVMAHIRGPDYAQGTLISSDDAVLKLYEEGANTLKYRCRYKFEQKKDSFCLVVTSHAPHFNVPSFLTRCGAMVEEGLLLSVNDATSARNGIRLVVEFEDPIVLRDRVLPLLYSNVHHKFYVLSYDEPTGESNIVPVNLMQTLHAFIDRRRLVESKIIQLDLEKLAAELSRNEAIYIAATNLDTLFSILRDSDNPKDDLVTQLKLTPEQADYVLNARVSSISKQDKTAVQEKIGKLREQETVLHKMLDDVDAVIVSHLNDIAAKYGDKRKMEIHAATPNLVTAPIRWLHWDGTSLTLLEDAVDDPSGKWIRSRRKIKWEGIIPFRESIFGVYENGMIKKFEMSYVGYGEFAERDGLVGLVSDIYDTFVLLDSQGSFGLVRRHQKVDEFQAFKHNWHIVKAVGMNVSTDALVVWTCDEKDHKHRYYPPGRLCTRLRRRGAQGYRPMPRRESLDFLVIPPNTKICRGTDFRFVKHPLKYTEANLFLLSEKTLCVMSNGRRRIYSNDKARKMLKYATTANKPKWHFNIPELSDG